MKPAPSETHAILGPMDVGITGLPGSGRTTVYRALLAHRAPAREGERRSESAIGTIHVQDPRLDRLASMFMPRKVTPIEIRLHDLCPSLETAFPTNEIEAMKRMDLLLLVAPAFTETGPEVAAMALERILGELYIEDLAAVERRLVRATREKIDSVEREALERAQEALENERPVATAELSQPQREALRGYALLTDRPMIAVQNTSEAQAGEPVPAALEERASRDCIPVLTLCASLEAEMADLAPDERAQFLTEFGVAESAGAAVTRAILDGGDIIPFFTVGEDECRAWPISRSTLARGAAGKIHSDIERGFIRAEVIPYADLIRLEGGIAQARKLGKLRLEGKSYEIQEGDVVNFRFNV